MKKNIISISIGALASLLLLMLMFGEKNAQSRSTQQTSQSSAAKVAQDVPEGFQQLLPRGGIPAIDNPQYVTADKARISDKAYIFGVVVEGQPVAYSLNLLNSHEIVNDTIGETNFAAVWWPLANTAVVYDRSYNGKALNFEASGGLTNASLVMQDKQTNTYWSLMKGKALTGKMKGETLNELSIGEKTTWKKWRTKHPTTKILSVNSKEDGRNPYQSYFRNQEGFRGLEAKDQRLKTKSPIFAFRHGEKAYAVAYAEIKSGVAFDLPDGSQVFLYRDRKDHLFRSTSVFISANGFIKDKKTWAEKETGNTFDKATRLFKTDIPRLNGFDTFWYNWSLNNPETELLTNEN